jgi:transcriptional regulator with XRE-family HTH domain
LGGLLRELRESIGLSQRVHAKKLDRTQAFVWKVEQGIQHLDIPTLIDMPRVLGTAASGLLQQVEATLTQSQRLRESLSIGPESVVESLQDELVRLHKIGQGRLQKVVGRV